MVAAPNEAFQTCQHTHPPNVHSPPLLSLPLSSPLSTCLIPSLTTSVPTRSPLNIHELLSLILFHLADISPASLALALQVSRFWFDVGVSPLWRTVRFDDCQGVFDHFLASRTAGNGAVTGATVSQMMAAMAGVETGMNTIGWPNRGPKGRFGIVDNRLTGFLGSVSSIS